jgi:hypothetical protein
MGWKALFVLSKGRKTLVFDFEEFDGDFREVTRDFQEVASTSAKLARDFQ